MTTWANYRRTNFSQITCAGSSFIGAWLSLLSLGKPTALLAYPVLFGETSNHSTIDEKVVKHKFCSKRTRNLTIVASNFVQERLIDGFYMLSVMFICFYFLTKCSRWNTECTPSTNQRLIRLFSLLYSAWTLDFGLSNRYLHCVYHWLRWHIMLTP